MEKKEEEKFEDQVLNYFIKKKLYKKWWFWLISVIIVAFIINAINQNHEDYNKSVQTTNTVKKEAPAKRPTFNDKIKKAADPHFGKVTNIEINDDLGKNDGGKIVLIHVKQDSLIKRTADYNTTKSLAKVFKIDKVNEITYFWEATLVDVKGNESVGVVDKIQMSKDTAKTINWDNFLYTNLEKVADYYHASTALK
jgi:hypothetical protein